MRVKFFCFYLSIVVTSPSLVLAQQQLEIYSCTNSDAIVSCSVNCKNAGFSASFQVNTLNSTVIQNLHESSKSPTLTIGLEFCKVVDKKNWVCKREEKFHGYKGYFFDAMSDGVYRSKAEFHGAVGVHKNSYFCTK